ncbi:uncharacterized protein LOC110840694, partial [Zootermopsis nevadensis]|uniref:uncharacterized protein LOC110840694 n=1 Tax=Zootermopsis nevadensis TaxID=136037 RepID=UPI000B8EE22E
PIKFGGFLDYSNDYHVFKKHFASAFSLERSKRDKESENAKGEESDGGTKARTKVKNLGEEKRVSSEQTNEERLSTVTSQLEGQQREEVDAAHNFKSCDVTEKTNKKLRGDLTAIQKRLDDVEKFMFGLGSNKCPMRLNEVGKVDAKTEQDLLETISKLKEAVERISFENETLLDKMREVTEQRRNEDKNNEAIKTLNEAVRTFKTDNFIDKISELQEQHQNEKKGNQETIKKLNEAVERISSENKKFLVKMAELEEKHHNEKKENEENINRLCEAMEIIALDNKKMNVKIKDLTKQRHNETNEDQEHIDTMGEPADMISFTNERRHVNMAEKNCRKVKYNDDIVNRLNRLNQAVDRISYDYKELKEEIGLFRNCFQDGDIAVAKPDEAV